MNIEEEEPNLTPTQLLKLAETHLRVRNFSLCHQYILQSQNPNHPLYNNHFANQLLILSNILLNPTNYYSILQITPLSNDFTLIKSQFNHIRSLINPIKHEFNVCNEALNLVFKAYDCLSDPTKKTQFDSEFFGQRSEKIEGFGDVGSEKFWTFCPYCFYMYEYFRVYEGCCLRCQNLSCRRAFHGGVVKSLPKMEFDEGVYFSCFGFFPLGFSPESEGLVKGSDGKFEGWSPIVGMFPMRRMGKARAGRVDMDNGGFDGVNDGEFIEVLDESDDGEVGYDHGVKCGNVGGVNVGSSDRVMKRKSVALNSRKLRSRRRESNVDGGGNGCEGYGEEDGYEGEDGFDVGYGVGVDDMAFFEENGEIFVEIGSDDALL